jgi:hypothetical protein
VNNLYSLDAHRHRFAAWAAIRAANRGVSGFTVERASKWFGEVGLKKLISNPEKLPSPSAVDKQHSIWRRKLISSAKKSGVKPLTHGQAAKLINVYLKSVFVCGGFHEHAHVRSLHPPIDGILLKRMSSKNFGGRKDWNEVPWTKMKSHQYQALIKRIRAVSNGQPLWKVGCFWPGF